MSNSQNTEPQHEHGMLHFEPSAYLQRLIGRELVADRYLALAELVKNAYDAGASEVTVTLSREKDTPQKLIVQDNGSGMTLEQFERFWMMPGYSEKGAQAASAADQSSDSSSNKGNGRTLLGEKGIGRFAADKLAHHLAVVSRVLRHTEALRVVFDWDDFNDRSKKMRDVNIPFEQISEHPFGRFGTGTRLELDDLREKWELKDWRKLRRELADLVTPFQGAKKFKIIANCEGQVTAAWKSGEIPSRIEAKDGYHYRFELTRAGKLRGSVKYPQYVEQEARKENIPLPQFESRDSYTDFGPVQGAFYYVESPRALKNTGIEGEEVEAGVAIYRDGFRVEPYGRENDDWLGVKTTKASRQGKAPITPSRLFGFIEINRYDNPNLRDRSNREGLMQTPELEAFIAFVSKQFQDFSKLVGQVEDSLGIAYKPQFAAQEASRMRENRTKAFGEMTAQMAHQLRQPMSVLQMDARLIRNRLGKTEALDDKTDEALTRIEDAVKRMDGHINSLSKLAEGLEQEPISIDLNDFVASLCQKHQADAQHNNVELRVLLPTPAEKVVFGLASLEFIVENFLTNALRAAATQAKQSSEQASVTVEIIKTSEGKRLVSVTDNGRGVEPSVKADLFVRSINAAAGHGKGLFWSHKHAESFRAILTCDNVPSRGAVFSIEFNSEPNTRAKTP